MIDKEIEQKIEEILSPIVFEGKEQVSDGYFRKERLIKMLYEAILFGQFNNEAEWTDLRYTWDLSQDFDHQSEAFYLFAWELLCE